MSVLLQSSGIVPSGGSARTTAIAEAAATAKTAPAVANVARTPITDAIPPPASSPLGGDEADERREQGERRPHAERDDRAGGQQLPHAADDGDDGVPDPGREDGDGNRPPVAGARGEAVRPRGGEGARDARDGEGDADHRRHERRPRGPRHAVQRPDEE